MLNWFHAKAFSSVPTWIRFKKQGNALLFSALGLITIISIGCLVSIRTAYPENTEPQRPNYIGCDFLNNGDIQSEVINGNDYHYIYGFSIVDIDGDGDLDITVSDAWYIDHDPERKRQRARLMALINTDYGFKEVELAGHILGDDTSALLEQQVVADMNGDGKPDIVAVMIFQNKLVWFENSGSVDAPWSMHQIPVPVHLPVSLKALGMREGAPSFLVGSFRSGGVSIVQKMNGSWINQAVIPPGFGDTRLIDFGDINGDGNPVVVAGSLPTGSIVYVDPVDGKSRRIPSEISRPFRGRLADVKGNGKLDILIPGERLAYLEGSQWTVKYLAPSCGPDHAWSDLQFADLDGDGNNDFVAVLRPKSSIIGGAVIMGIYTEGTYKLKTLIGDFPNASFAQIADIDADGALDVIAISDQPNNEVRLWRAPAM